MGSMGVAAGADRRGTINGATNRQSRRLREWRPPPGLHEKR